MLGLVSDAILQATQPTPSNATLYRAWLTAVKIPPRKRSKSLNRLLATSCPQVIQMSAATMFDMVHELEPSEVCIQSNRQ
jgi:hypothetical protein